GPGDDALALRGSAGRPEDALRELLARLRQDRMDLVSGGVRAGRGEAGGSPGRLGHRVLHGAGLGIRTTLSGSPPESVDISCPSPLCISPIIRHAVCLVYFSCVPRCSGPWSERPPRSCSESPGSMISAGTASSASTTTIGTRSGRRR